MESVIQFEGTIYENGYGLIAQKVMRDKTLSKQAKVIYSYMCSFAGVGKDGERSAFPSVSLQCHELGMSEKTYYRWREQLVSKGYIKIKKNRQDGAKFANNIYSIVAVPVATIENGEKKPYGKNDSTVEPYGKNACTEKACTENDGTIINSSISNIFKKEEEEDYIYTGESEIPESAQDQERERLQPKADTPLTVSLGIIEQQPKADYQLQEDPKADNLLSVSADDLIRQNPAYDYLSSYLLHQGIRSDYVSDVIIQCERHGLQEVSAKDIQGQYRHMMGKVQNEDTIYDFTSYFVGGLQRRRDLRIASNVQEQQDKQEAAQRASKKVPLYNWLEDRD